MKMRFIVMALFLELFFLGMLTSAVAAPDTRYVSDQLVITLREGMGNQFRVIRTLKTDTSMEVLSAQGQYLYVKLSDGTQGYVLKQYVSRATPKSFTIKRLQNELAQLQPQLKGQNELQQQLVEAKKTVAMTEQLLESTKVELKDLQVKAENVMLIDEERQRLKEELGAANGELTQLRNDNAAMLKTAMIKWFVAGGGVLFLGWVAGKFSRKKKRGLGSF
ncbi:MAG: hypothetical protein B6I36_00810 [Desulfobacteraceae bacterium 4572_35.1]|nr:MAG: hypothetical protein B6I36_00810 [Desulfobacteraceae bacterium 4572_35.1]